MKKFELEEDIEISSCNKIWKWLGIKGYKLKIVGETGFPDRIFFIPGGRPYLAEYKLPGEPARAKQKYIHNMLTILGYKIGVFDNEYDAIQAIIQAVESTRLSKESRKILTEARRRCSLLRPGSG